MKILVLGAGAIGGYIGGRLNEAGADVTFLVRNARKSQLDHNGLTLHSVFGDLHTAVITTNVDELLPIYNFVILVVFEVCYVHGIIIINLFLEQIMV